MDLKTLGAATAMLVTSACAASAGTHTYRCEIDAGDQVDALPPVIVFTYLTDRDADQALVGYELPEAGDLLPVWGAAAIREDHVTVDWTLKPRNLDDEIEKFPGDFRLHLITDDNTVVIKRVVDGAADAVRGFGTCALHQS